MQDAHTAARHSAAPKEPQMLTLADLVVVAVCGLLLIGAVVGGRTRASVAAVEECPSCEARWTAKAGDAGRASADLAALRAEHDKARHPDGHTEPA